MKTFLFLFCGSIFMAMIATKPKQKIEPYRHDIRYEYQYSDEEIKAIEDSVKKSNGVAD